MTSGSAKPKISTTTRAEQETETEANRLIEQVELALATVAMSSVEEPDNLDAAAHRIERVARDLANALRDLAEERKSASEEN